MIRITNTMLAQNAIRNINNNMQQLDTAQTQMSTQSKIQLPSDDPVAATKALKYRNYVSTITQYQANASDATSWMKVTESSLSDLTDIVTQIRDLTVQASSSALTTSDEADIASQISELKANAIETLNATYAGRYVFGGYATDKAPYAVVSTTVGSTSVNQITFKGKYLSLYGVVSSTLTDTDLVTAYNTYASTTTGTVTTSNIYTTTAAQTIQYNTGYSSETAVNVEGQNVTGLTASGTTTITNLFDTIDKLLIGLGESGTTKSCKSVSVVSGTPTVTTSTFTLSDLLTNIDSNLAQISTATSDLGARENYVSTCSNRLGDDYTTYTKLLSDVEDVDVADASVNVTSTQAVYDASLSVSAKVLSETLIDYIK
jgi:flagellar hook-associated protein 3 FlgL